MAGAQQLEKSRPIAIHINASKPDGVRTASSSRGPGGPGGIPPSVGFHFPEHPEDGVGRGVFNLPSQTQSVVPSVATMRYDGRNASGKPLKSEVLIPHVVVTDSNAFELASLISAYRYNINLQDQETQQTDQTDQQIHPVIPHVRLHQQDLKPENKYGGSVYITGVSKADEINPQTARAIAQLVKDATSSTEVLIAHGDKINIGLFDMLARDRLRGSRSDIPADVMTHLQSVEEVSPEYYSVTGGLIQGTLLRVYIGWRDDPRSNPASDAVVRVYEYPVPAEYITGTQKNETGIPKTVRRETPSSAYDGIVSESDQGDLPQVVTIRRSIKEQVIQAAHSLFAQIPGIRRTGSETDPRKIQRDADKIVRRLQAKEKKYTPNHKQ